VSSHLQTRRHRTVFACLTLASLAVIACGTEQLSSPRPTESPLFAAGGKKPAKPTISDASGPSTLGIGDGAGAYAVTISNQTSASLSNVSLQASIDQGSASRAAGSLSVVCNGGPVGVLQVGSCAVSLLATASNGAAGNGTLIPGNAKLVINLVQTVSGTPTILDTKTLRISLTAADSHTAPYISNLITNFTTFVDGVGQDYTVTLTNPTGTNQSPVTIQAYFVQNGVAYAGGGTNVICPVLDLTGNLPPGDCTFTWHTSLNVPRPAAGQATWRLELFTTTTSGTVVLDFKEVSVTVQ